MKDKLIEASSCAGELVDKGEEWARNKADDVRGYVGQAQPWIDSADNILNKMSGPKMASGPGMNGGNRSSKPVLQIHTEGHGIGSRYNRGKLGIPEEDRNRRNERMNEFHRQTAQQRSDDLANRRTFNLQYM